MGYNLSRHSVIRNRPQLDQLLEALEFKASLHFPTSSPAKLAYKLREALLASLEHPEFEYYFNSLASAFVFKITPNGVFAEFQENPVGEVVERVVGSPKPRSPQKRSIPDAMDYLEVLGAAMKFQTEDELHFPNVIMLISDRRDLLSWASANGWKYIDHEGAGVTLTKREVPEEVLWREEDEST